MADRLYTIFSDAFAIMIILVFLIEICFQCSNQEYASVGVDNAVAKMLQAIIWTKYDLIYWRIYASLDHNDQYCEHLQSWK